MAPVIKSLLCGQQASHLSPSSCSALLITSITSQNFQPVDIIYLVSQGNTWYYPLCHNKGKRYLLFLFSSLFRKFLGRLKKLHLLNNKPQTNLLQISNHALSFGHEETLHLKIGMLCRWSPPSRPPVLACGLWLIHRVVLEIPLSLPVSP